MVQYGGQNAQAGAKYFATQTFLTSVHIVHLAVDTKMLESALSNSRQACKIAVGFTAGKRAAIWTTLTDEEGMPAGRARASQTSGAVRKIFCQSRKHDTFVMANASARAAAAYIDCD